MKPRVAVVGGGLAGLTVALRCADAGLEVTVFEAAARFGGQLSSVDEDGFVVELGAEGFVARSEAVPALARRVGVDGALIGQRTMTSSRFDGRHLVVLQPGEAAEALSFQVARADKGAGIKTFARGMQTLSDALAECLLADSRVSLRLGQAVSSLTRVSGATGIVVDGAAETFDRVVLATPSAAAARLLADSELPEVDVRTLALALAGPTLSSVTVTLAFLRSEVDHGLEGTGFVVAEPFEGFRAATFVSSKFAARVPDGVVSVRAFFRPTSEELARDEPWIERATRVLGRVVPLRGRPHRAWLSLWPDALPVFTPEHRGAVADAEGALAPLGIHLTGSAFHGSGIDAAVRSADALGDHLIGELG